jgi:hypothetical protein
VGPVPLQRKFTIQEFPHESGTHFYKTKKEGKKRQYPGNKGYLRQNWEMCLSLDMVQPAWELVRDKGVTRSFPEKRSYPNLHWKQLPGAAIMKGDRHL